MNSVTIVSLFSLLILTVNSFAHSTNLGAINFDSLESNDYGGGESNDFNGNGDSGTFPFEGSNYHKERSLGVKSTSTSATFGNVDPLEIKSALCPGVATESLERYRYDAKAAKCSPQGQKAHCGENMAFYGVLHNDVYGECDCLYNSLRPLIYSVEGKRCYFVYEQAYCRKGEWLTFRKHDGRAECSFNKCQTPDMPNTPSNVYVPLNGDGPCVVLNTYSERCPNPDEIVSFIAGELTPRCAKQIPGTRGLALARQLKCKSGSYLNIVRKCQPAFIW